MAYINGKEILFSAIIGGGGAQVALNAPSISLDLYTATLTITDTLNGNFVSGYKIYKNDTFIATVTEKTVVLTDYAERTEDVTIKVCAVGENFIDSEFANVEWTKPPLYAPTIAIDNVTDTLTITDTNGENANGFEIYANGTLLATVTETTVVLSEYMELTETQIITVTTLSGNESYIDSVLSNEVIWFEKTAGTEGLTYEYLNIAQKYYKCTGEGSATDKDIIIASIYQGLLVINIAPNAFKDSSITRVKIPDSVTVIEGYAFYGCKQLTELTIPKSVVSFHTSAFTGADYPLNFEDVYGWKLTRYAGEEVIEVNPEWISNPETAREYYNQYYDYRWDKESEA